MKPLRIAAFTILGNAHRYPVLGLCSELVKRGHIVTFATDVRYEHEVKSIGAEPVLFRPARIENVDSFFRASSFYDQHWYTMWASHTGPLLLLYAAGALSQLEGYYRENRPDLILYDRASFVGRMLAARLGCHAIQLSPHFAPYDDTFIREDGKFLNPEPIGAFSTVLDRFLQAYGIRTSNNLTHTEELNIYFISKEFQVHGDSFDQRFCFVGPCHNRPTRSGWRNNSAGRPIVLVSGSQVDDGLAYFKTMIEAFSGSTFYVILSPGAHFSCDAFGAIPDNVEINWDAYNFQILPHATLAISQGGTGTAMESLYYGVPLLVVPRMPVHAETAYRLAELGLGVYLPERMMSVDSVNSSVAQLLGDASLADRIENMKKSLRSSGGAEMAANRIEHFMAARNALNGPRSDDAN